MEKLEKDALSGLVTRSAMLIALIFIPAGTIHYWQAWLFMGVFTLCNIALTAYLWKYDQKLLSQRVYGGHRLEQERVQKIIMLTLSIISLVQVIVSALDYRLEWSRMSTAVVLAGDALIVMGFVITSVVFRINGHASATIETTSDQKVISTGPYAFVRHPMYAGGFLTLLGIPIALGSWWGVAIFAAMTPLFVLRLIHEEHFLRERLPGYKEYQAQVRWRLFPGIF